MNQKLESQLDEELSSLFRGEIAQLRVQEVAARKGYLVSIPSTEIRYDIIIDINGNLLRGQIKNCNRKSSDGVNLEVKLYNKKRNGGKPYTKDQIDLLLVYVSKLDRVLCFGPEIFHEKKTITINLTNKNSKYYWEKFKW